MDANVRSAVCTDYERLLKESQRALAAFKAHMKWDDELHNLQLKYDKAYSRLRNHSRNCELCQSARAQLHAAA